jgi:polar amino acid transport system substrate-binding protein
MGSFDVLGKRTASRNRSPWWCLLVLSLLGLFGSATQAAAPAPFLLATDLHESSLMGKWYRRIYGEVFARMGVPLEVLTVPVARMTNIVDLGDAHGQASRVFAYADSHPNQIRVEEAVHDVRLALYAFVPPSPSGQPRDQPRRLDDLASGKWLVEYRRGVAICEKTLKPVLPAERLSDVTTVEQALRKLKAGRTDLYCDFDSSVRNELVTAAFNTETGYRQVLDLNVGLPLYPYLHRSRADLAPRLAEVLRKMKAEGLIERYLHEAERELGVMR